MAKASAKERKRSVKAVPPGAATVTPPQAAIPLQMSPDTIRTLIEAGELRAFNVARKGSRRPRYRIALEDLEAFKARRAVNPKAPAAPRRTPDGNVTQYV